MYGNSWANIIFSSRYQVTFNNNKNMCRLMPDLGHIFPYFFYLSFRKFSPFYKVKEKISWNSHSRIQPIFFSKSPQLWQLSVRIVFCCIVVCSEKEMKTLQRIFCHTNILISKKIFKILISTKCVKSKNTLLMTLFSIFN